MFIMFPDAKTLCCAVTSLKSLALLIKSSTTPEALALIFSHKTLEDMFTNLPNVSLMHCRIILRVAEGNTVGLTYSIAKALRLYHALFIIHVW